MIDAAKEKRHRTELRFHLETPEGSAHFPREIDVKTVKMLGWWWLLYVLILSWDFKRNHSTPTKPQVEVRSSCIPHAKPRTFREFISEGPQVPRDMDKMDISSTSSVHLVADADFVSSPVAFRVHVASDANRSDPCHEKNHLVFLSCCGCSSNSDRSGGLFMSGRRAI